MMRPRECQNCGHTAPGEMMHEFPDGHGGSLFACDACRADVRAYARNARRALRAYRRRCAGQARLAGFKARGKSKRALARFITMHAACAALGGVA